MHRFLLSLILSALVAGFTTSCRDPHTPNSEGLIPMRLQLDWYPQPEHGGFFTAQLRGYYKAEGLDVTILPIPFYGSVAQMMYTGKVDVGLSASDQILEWADNELPMIAVAATLQHDPQAVMVHKDSPVHGFADLEGRTVAAQTGATWLKFVARQYHLHDVRQVPSTLSIANFLNNPDYIQQIFITSEPYFAKQAGAEVRTFLISSSGYDPYRVQFTTREFAQKHPELVERFVRASIRGWREYLRDPGPTNAYLLKLNPALNPAQEAYTAKALQDGHFVEGSDPGIDMTGRMTAERWKATYEQLRALGIIRNSFDPSIAYSLKFAEGSVGSRE